MGKHEKLLARLQGKPCARDFSWSDLATLLSHFGYAEQTGSGSRRKFIRAATKHVISLHKRHPDDTLLQYQIKDVLNSLKEEGVI
ncbi:MAG: type II toxin-antitoxin system HicA family toxin [bacterium]